MSPKKRSPVDAIVGRNVRVQRLAAGMSQQELARKIGVSFQQIQKYEKGTNRVGAGRLYRLAEIFGVPIAVLFEGVAAVPRDQRAGVSPAELIAEPQAFRLVRAFADITDIGLRSCIVVLVEQIAVDGRKPAAPPRRDAH
jgi:transcriptional regulator with XRE-family HTH domain